MTPKAEGEGSGGSARASYVVGAGILLSRLFGLVRQRVFGHYFGTTDYADAFTAALRLPNVIQNLLGEGTLSASFIPIYSEQLEEGREEDAGRFAGAVLGILTTVAGGLVLLGVLLAPLFIPLIFPDFPEWKQDLTVTLVQILFPMTGILVVSAWCLGVLNSHRRFFVPYVAPVLWSVAQIVTLIGLGTYLAFGQRRLVVALAWGALVGGVLQMAIQLPWVVRVMRHFRLSLSTSVVGVREAIRNFLPVVAARGVVNLSGWLDLVLAGLLTSGAIAVLGYVQTLYMLPISLFGMSIAASELPDLSRRRGEGAKVLAERVRNALGRLAFFIVPSIVGYLFLGDVVVGAIYQTGRFDVRETMVTWVVLGAYTVGLLASSSSRVLSSAYYALRDTRTPAKVAYLRVFLSAAVGAAVMFPLDRYGFQGLRLGAAGLGVGASVGAWVEVFLLRRLLARQIGDHTPDRGRLLRIWLAAALAAAAGVGAQLLMPDLHPIVLAAGTIAPFGVVYFATAALLGVSGPLRRFFSSS